MSESDAGSTQSDTWSFTIVEEQDSAPTLNVSQNLDSCLTRPNKKCVAVGNTASLKFDISDINNNLSRLDINWGGLDLPESSSLISGGYEIVGNSYVYSSADIADCPDNEYYRNDGVCWKKDVTITATAYDSSNNASNIFSQEFILYDSNGYNAAKEQLENAKKELAEQESSHEQQSSQEAVIASNIESLTDSCQSTKKVDWKVNNTLLKDDPFRERNNVLEYCRKDNYTLISCSSADSQCSSLADLGVGINYDIKTTYDYKSYNVSCTNYPAKVESSYTIDGVKSTYETEFVNNYQQKTDYLTNVSNRLKNELIAKSSGRYVGKCNLDDYSEWTLDEWKSKVREHQGFNDAAIKYAQKQGVSLSEAKRGIAAGVGKALHEIAKEYKELPGTVTDVISGALSLVGNFITKPLETSSKLKEEAGRIGGLALEISAEIAEIIPTLPNAISHLSVYDKSFFTAYVTTLVAHELAPTSKLKLLKLSKLKRPKWLLEALLYVRIKSLKLSIPKSNLDFLDESSKRIFVKQLDIKNYPSSDVSRLLAKNLSKKNGNKQWFKNFKRGNKFNKEQWNPKYKNELYLCKSPNGCAEKPPKYVRLDAYNDTVIPRQIISRKHTQFSEVKYETAKGYLDELATKYKPGMKGADVPSNIKGTELNKTNAGMSGRSIDGIQVLEIPTQSKPIPQSIIDYADSLDIEIIQVKTSIPYK